MPGIYQGVQAHVKEINPLASFAPCAAHSLNFIGVNVVSKCLPAKLVLGQVQNLYTFFSKSTFCWSILVKYTSWTLKNQSSTRWSSKARAVSSVALQFYEIYEALCNILCNDSTNAETVAKAEVQILQIFNFHFILSVTIWGKY